METCTTDWEDGTGSSTQAETLIQGQIGLGTTRRGINSTAHRTKPTQVGCAECLGTLASHPEPVSTGFLQSARKLISGRVMPQTHAWIL
jgi:hypothetical protein